VVLFSTLHGWSTHIVGGDIFYKHVGSNRYEITVKVYFDCLNGSAQAIQSDNVIYVGQYDARTNRYEKKYTFFRTGPRRLNDGLVYACASAQTNACVDEYVYKQTITVDPGFFGKILAFQRCCRNNTIINIFDPGGTGATYWVKIPGSQQTTIPNNSAVFTQLPPNYVCVNAPFQFDHSAVDPDGDSLVYKLYQPYEGANRDDPRPDVPSNPPYDNVQWRTGYNTNRQMNSDPVFKINSATGEVNAYPTKLGQFVVGIKVMEFRDGRLIGETMRDYQINVVNCNFLLISDFVVANASVADNNTFICTDSVQFTNQSKKAVKYLWKFGDPTRTDDTSNQTNPYWVYPGNGDYKVTLIAYNAVCIDSIHLTVSIRSDIKVDLGPDEIFCHKVDKWLDAKNYTASDWVWNVGRFGPTLRAQEPGKYKVTVNYGDCIGEDSITLFVDSVPFDMTKDSLFCEEVDAEIEISPDGLQYEWDDDPSITENRRYFNRPGTYYVTVTNENDCQRTDSVRFWLATVPEIGDSFFFCNEFELTRSVGDIEEGEFLWSNGSTASSTTLRTEGTHWVRVRQRYCEFADTIKIKNPVITIQLGGDKHFCDTVYSELSGPNSMALYQWSTGESSQNIVVRDEGQYRLYVMDTFGCESTDSVYYSLSESPRISIGNDTAICVREQAVIGTENESFLSYRWNTGQTDRLIFVESPGVYTQTVRDEQGCIGKDSMTLKQDPEALPNNLFIPNAFSPNGDNLNDYFPYSIPIDQPAFECQVFNRWGEKVFDSKVNGTNHWDGQYKGKLAAGGPFVYVISYRACNGNQKVQSGTLTFSQ
jgi:gliding motility-associated-like protein